MSCKKASSRKECKEAFTRLNNIPFEKRSNQIALSRQYCYNYMYMYIVWVSSLLSFFILYLCMLIRMSISFLVWPETFGSANETGGIPSNSQGIHSFLLHSSFVLQSTALNCLNCMNSFDSLKHPMSALIFHPDNIQVLEPTCSSQNQPSVKKPRSH